MNDLMQKSILESIKIVMGQIAEIDEGLAGLFGRIAEILPDEKRRRGESERDINKRNEGIVKGTFDKIGTRGAINTYPFGEPSDCLEECLAITLGKISYKYGFNQVVWELIKYWLSCSKINFRTLIVTDAWDITDFNSRYKVAFDKYVSSNNKDNRKHTVAIVSYGDYGFLLQYLR
jgi:hypothetical protein